MDPIDPQALQTTVQLLNQINTVLTTVTSKMQSIVSLIPGATESVNKYGDAQQRFVEKQNAAIKSSEAYAKSVSDSSDTTSAFAEMISNAGTSATDAFGVLAEAAKKVEGGIGGIVAETTGLKTADDQVNAVASTFSALSLIALGVHKNLYGIGNGMDTIGTSSATGAAKVATLTAMLGKMSSLSIIGGAFKGAQAILNEVGKFAEAVDETKKLENALMGLRASFGGFKESTKGEFVQDLNKEMSRFNNIVTDVGTATNTSAEEAERYAFELMKIPGAYDQVVSGIGNTSEEIKLLEAAMRVARGTTGNFKDSTEALDLQFRQFGITGKESLDYLSRMYELSNLVGIAFKDFQKPVEEIVRGFASLGDNTESATNLVGGLMRSLKDTGIGVEPINRIIGSLSKSMEGLGMAQKAFLSEQTGGSGGLRGAFEIDQMVAEGNVSGLYQKMEQTLMQQFGGKAVTLQEASQSDSAAAELAKQVAFLRQGPFGQMVQSDQDAYKLLEAMASGTGPDQEMLKRGQDALTGAMNTDQEIQLAQSDILTTISNSTQASLKEMQLLTSILGRSVAKSMGDITSVAESDARLRSVLAGKPTKGTDSFDYDPTRSVLSALGNTASLAIGEQGDDQVPTAPGRGGVIPALRRLPGVLREAATQTLTPPDLSPSRGVGGSAMGINAPEGSGISGPVPVSFADGTVLSIEIRHPDGSKEMTQGRLSTNSAVAGVR